MSITTSNDVANIINRHITSVSAQHHLAFTMKFEGVQFFICACSKTRMDRWNYNAHINDVYQMGVIERPARS